MAEASPLDLNSILLQPESSNLITTISLHQVLSLLSFDSILYSIIVFTSFHISKCLPLARCLVPPSGELSLLRSDRYVGLFGASSIEL
jgi:hypothetical protein